MPVARRGTPPTSQIKQTKGVLTSLSAWTDTGEEEAPTKRSAYRALLEGEAEGNSTFLMKVRAFFDPEGDNFNIFIGLVILANAIVIGLETEFGAGNFIYLEHSFNAAFFLEMCLRTSALGAHYFKEPWNLFDFTLVCTGTLDLWILPLFTIGHARGVLYHFSVMRMLRILRLMRILRVVRLFRMFQQLYLIMQAFNKAFQIVLLMGLLVLILDYVFAIMLTQGLGHQAHMWPDSDDQVKVQAWFGSIPGSMQTLFQIMTMSDWSEISTVLVKVLPSSLVYGGIVLYIMITSYTMISLITGIISESLITAQQEYRLRKENQMDVKKKALSYELREFLYQMHEDEKDEFNNVQGDDLKTSMRGDTELLHKLAAINVNIDESGILGLIDKLSATSKDQSVNIDHFVDKLTNLVGVASASSVMDLKYELSKMTVKIDKLCEKMGIEDPFRSTRAFGEPHQRPSVIVGGDGGGGPRRSSLKLGAIDPVASERVNALKGTHCRFQEER